MAGRPQRAVKRTQIALRLEPHEIAAIDAARGDTPRTQWIVAKAMKATRDEGAAPRSRHALPGVTKR
jgi:hypothetical protein